MAAGLSGMHPVDQPAISAARRSGDEVLVQREMDSGRSPVVSITPRTAQRRPADEAVGETQTVFKEEIGLGAPIRQGIAGHGSLTVYRGLWARLKQRLVL